MPKARPAVTRSTVTGSERISAGVSPGLTVGGWVVAVETDHVCRAAIAGAGEDGGKAFHLAGAAVAAQCIGTRGLLQSGGDDALHLQMPNTPLV